MQSVKIPSFFSTFYRCDLNFSCFLHKSWLATPMMKNALSFWPWIFLVPPAAPHPTTVHTPTRSWTQSRQNREDGLKLARGWLFSPLRMYCCQILPFMTHGFPQGRSLQAQQGCAVLLEMKESAHVLLFVPLSSVGGGPGVTKVTAGLSGCPLPTLTQSSHGNRFGKQIQVLPTTSG